MHRPRVLSALCSGGGKPECSGGPVAGEKVQRRALRSAFSCWRTLQPRQRPRRHGGNRPRESAGKPNCPPTWPPCAEQLQQVLIGGVLGLGRLRPAGQPAAAARSRGCGACRGGPQLLRRGSVPRQHAVGGAGGLAEEEHAASKMRPVSLRQELQARLQPAKLQLQESADLGCRGRVNRPESRLLSSAGQM